MLLQADKKPAAAALVSADIQTDLSCFAADQEPGPGSWPLLADAHPATPTTSSSRASANGQQANKQHTSLSIGHAHTGGAATSGAAEEEAWPRSPISEALSPRSAVKRSSSPSPPAAAGEPAGSSSGATLSPTRSKRASRASDDDGSKAGAHSPSSSGNAHSPHLHSSSHAPGHIQGPHSISPPQQRSVRFFVDDEALPPGANASTSATTTSSTSSSKPPLKDNVKHGLKAISPPPSPRWSLTDAAVTPPSNAPKDPVLLSLQRQVKQAVSLASHLQQEYDDQQTQIKELVRQRRDFASRYAIPAKNCSAGWCIERYSFERVK